MFRSSRASSCRRVDPVPETSSARTTGGITSIFIHRAAWLGSRGGRTPIALSALSLLPLELAQPMIGSGAGGGKGYEWE